MIQLRAVLRGGDVVVRVDLPHQTVRCTHWRMQWEGGVSMSRAPSSILGGDGREGHFMWGSVRGGGLAVVGGREGRGRGVAVTLEERVLQGIKWFDPCLRVIVQHPQNQILEFPVVVLK